mgnify:CR=1 FL=1
MGEYDIDPQPVSQDVDKLLLIYVTNIPFNEAKYALVNGGVNHIDDLFFSAITEIPEYANLSAGIITALMAGTMIDYKVIPLYQSSDVKKISELFKKASMSLTTGSKNCPSCNSIP